MLYAITNRQLYGGNEASRRSSLLELTAIWATNGVAFIQLREKDLPVRDQVELARAMLREIRAARNSQSPSQPAAQLLINSRPDVALAAGADGVHLPAGPAALTPGEVRSIFAAAGNTAPPIISISCHTLSEVEAARQQVDCILFAPVFEKVVAEDATDPSRQKTLPGTGLALLQQACRAAGQIPVYALGGVTVKNAPQCLRAGAAGIAAIRLMMESTPVWVHLARQ